MTSTVQNESPDTAHRPGLKPWKKGQSGNPNGRKPKGLATVEKLREALVPEIKDIIAKVVEQAKGGDLTAARLIFERVMPPMKAIEAPVYLDALTGTLTEQGATILSAMAAGTLAPAQAAQLLGALAAQAKILEIDDYGRRLTELEAKIGRSGNAEHGT